MAKSTAGEYFEGGKIDRVGIDRDSDGEVDDWELAARPLRQRNKV